MKTLVIASLVVAQALAAAQPVYAAELIAREAPQMGAFAGARVRIPLGARAHRQLRAGLTIAPTMRARGGDGAIRTRFGEGFELGIAQDRRVALSFAGTRMDRIGLAPGGTTPGGRRAGVSTLGWVAIGVGTAVLVVATAGFIWLRDIQDCDPGEDCT